MQKIWGLINFACVLLALSACGWQLRNNPLLTDPFGTVHISHATSQMSLAIELKRALQANNVTLVGAVDNADYRIKILAVNQSRRISALNPNARASQYQIYQAVDYLVVDAWGTQIIPPTTALAETDYNFDESNILASESEEAFLQSNLRSEIVRQIVHRLGEVSYERTGNP
jgi:LPS-assembly lipoprotein